MTRRYLIITPAYAPNMSARSFRWTTLAEYWAAQGYEIDVISAWEANFASKELLHGVHVYRVNATFVEKVRGFFKKSDTRVTGAQKPDVKSAQLASWKARAAAVVRWIYHRGYRQIYWPDGGFLWRIPAIKQARALLVIKKYDAMITVSPHFTAHLVGATLHRDHPDLHWVLDIGDPFSYVEIEPHNNLTLYRGLNRRVERNIFRMANQISVTTDLTSEIYAQIFPESAPKLHVIPPLLSLPERNPTPQERIFPEDETIRLVFVGLLYPKIRPPDFLLQLFSALVHAPLDKKVELHIFGDMRQVHAIFEQYSASLGDTLMLHGVVSRVRVVQASQEANVLVNVGNMTPYQLPSKVVEYASTGKPILNLTYIANDSSSAFFKTYPAALSVNQASGSLLAEQVEKTRQFLSHLPAPLPPAWVDTWLSAFKLESIAAAYDKLTDDNRTDATQ